MALFGSKKRSESCCPMCGVGFAGSPMDHASVHVSPVQSVAGIRYSWGCCGGPDGSWEEEDPAAAGLTVHWMQVHQISI
jgi:hypothetical protein